MIPRETFTWYCDHCHVAETLGDLDDAYRAARHHTITVHGVNDNAPTIEHQEAR